VIQENSKLYEDIYDRDVGIQRYYHSNYRENEIQVQSKAENLEENYGLYWQ